jgi:DNA-directed RNA polymerase specialized sigma24 family protein
VATEAEESAMGATQIDSTTAATSYPDPRDPRTLARLMKRTPSGGYEIADTELVRAIRGWDAQGLRSVAMELCGLLVERCMPEFRRHAAGLRHRPDLMEDTIAAMIEQVLREALDPSEVFMTQNFIHYLRCLCADNFNRTLRQEGLRYRRDEQGRPTGRPQHIPRALIEQIDLPNDDQDEQGAGTGAVPDPRDSLNERLAAVEAQRILTYLPDPLDQRIFALRALYKMQWEEIATLCGKTERTMRLRFEKARRLLQACLGAEVAAAAGASGEYSR